MIPSSYKGKARALPNSNNNNNPAYTRFRRRLQFDTHTHTPSDSLHPRAGTSSPSPSPGSIIEGNGDEDGVVLQLAVISTGILDAAYSIPVQIGASSYALQIDTGSSDLWVASSSCSSCSTSGVSSQKLYNPSSSSTSTPAPPSVPDFKISYLSGGVEGPVYWDAVVLGGYAIDNQALAAATSITGEPLTPSFLGVLGLALPLNSIIASPQYLPPVTTNAPDGAAFASNLFSITPASNAPAARFISMSLSRPGSSRIPALLGVGHHPSAIVSDPSSITYTQLVAEASGVLFWKTSVHAISLWVNGVERPVDVGRSVVPVGDDNPGGGARGGMAVGGNPVAILDSGVPLILVGNVNLANGIYGAVGVGPAANGMYYVPCTTPLNMTITLDGRPPLPLHPLDLTGIYGPDPNTCLGLIQVTDLTEAHTDIILGVPFLRNVYTVMAYEVPNQNGTFSSPTGGGSGQTAAAAAAGSGGTVQPRLGLMSVTDPSWAMDEFHTVRVLNKPLDTNSSNSASMPNNSDGGAGVRVAGKRLSVGVVVLLGLLGFFALCFSLFGVRFFLLRRKMRRSGKNFATGGDVKGAVAFRLALRARKSGDGKGEEGGPGEEELRRLKFEAYVRKERELREEWTLSADSGRTWVDDGDAINNSNKIGEFGDRGHHNDEGKRHLENERLYGLQHQQLFGLQVERSTEEGYVRREGTGEAEEEVVARRHEEQEWDPQAELAWGDETLADRGRRNTHDEPGSPERAPHHHRSPTELNIAAADQQHHGRSASLTAPLLASEIEEPPSSFNNVNIAIPVPDGTTSKNLDLLDEFGVLNEEGGTRGGGMAGIGTASRTSKIDSGFGSGDFGHRPFPGAGVGSFGSMDAFRMTNSTAFPSTTPPLIPPPPVVLSPSQQVTSPDEISPRSVSERGRPGRAPAGPRKSLNSRLSESSF